MKKIILGIFGLSMVYVMACVAFKIVYDQPPTISSVRFASYRVGGNPDKATLEKKLGSLPEISACTYNPKTATITVLYYPERTAQPREFISAACGLSLTDQPLQAGAGGGCPYHAFMDGIAPYFTWNFTR